MGIYIGNDQFIHASSSKGVMINSVTSPYYASKLIGYKSLVLTFNRAYHKFGFFEEKDRCTYLK